jgi:hypothetical protein
MVSWLQRAADITSGPGTRLQPVLPSPCCRYVRDLPVDYLPLLENSCDPGHVHFTHAGFIGSAAQAGPLAIKLLQQVCEADAPGAVKLRNFGAMFIMPGSA